MSLKKQFKMLSRYNSWMNEKVYAACDKLPDLDRKMDVGSFFGSIHRTLDHIVYGDTAWLERLRDRQFTPRKPSDLMFNSWDDLKNQRSILDLQIDGWIDALYEEDFEVEFTYKSNMDNITRTAPYWSLVIHMFNHQTHHRGQVTTLLNQRGIDIGATDIPAMPRFEI